MAMAKAPYDKLKERNKDGAKANGEKLRKKIKEEKEKAKKGKK